VALPGSRRYHDARGEGWIVNHKKLQRVWREEGLRVPIRARRKRVGSSTAPGTPRADAPNRVWAVDFQFDSTTDGRPVKIASIIDEHTRECLGGLVARSITGDDLIDELDRLAVQRGYPGFLSMQVAELDPQLLTLIAQYPAGPALLAETGVGPVVAAQLLISWSHHGRVRSEAASASLAGVAPIEISSGQHHRHRLNRGGDRALNRALHTVAITRIRCHPETRDYEIRRAAQGKTHRDIRRSLKRALARRLYRRIETAIRLHNASVAA
jgi:transposase